MADNKKYYYLKLKDNFYDSEQMIILQNMQDGYLYSDILMKLYLRSLKNDGKLMFNDLIPYTPSVLAQVVRHQVGTVEKALDIFQKLGLIEILDNGAIYMLDIQNFIGKSSTEADRIRNYRQEIKQEQIECTNVQQMYDKSTPEIEIEKEIELEIKKEKDIKHKYGEYQHVLLTDKQLEELKKEYSNYEELIKYLDEYIEMKGYKAKNHYLAIKKWVVSAVKENIIRNNKLNNSQTKNAFAELLEEENDEQKRNIINAEYIEKCIS